MFKDYGSSLKTDEVTAFLDRLNIQILQARTFLI